MQILDIFDYDTKDYRIEYLDTYKDKFQYTYQTMGTYYKTKLIESIFLGLPSLPIYVHEDLKVIIGSELIQTYQEYLNNEFALKAKGCLITEFAGKYFKDLTPYYQRQFKLTFLRIVLVSKANEDAVNLLKYTFGETYREL